MCVTSARRVDATKFNSIGGGWIFSAHGEGGYIAPLQKSPGPGRDAVRLTDRFFDIGLRGFDIRGLGPRVQRVPYKADGTLDLTQAVITDAIGARAYYMGRLELQFPTSSGLKSMGIRPSAFIDVGSLWNITTAAPAGRPQHLLADRNGDDADRIHHQRGRLQRRLERRRARRDAVHRKPRVPGTLPRKFVQAASVDRHRRQLGFALRAAAHRPCQGVAQAKGRRHQIVQLQRRNSILMKRLLISASLAASAALPSAAQAQAIPPAVVAVVDLDRSRPTATPARPRAALQSQARPGSREKALAAPLQTEQQALQAAVDALNGKQPDAALQARAKAFQNKHQAARPEAAARAGSSSSATSNMSHKQIQDKLGPIYTQVMQRRGANVMVEQGATLATATSRRRHQ